MSHLFYLGPGFISNLVVIDQLLTEKSVFKRLLGKFANIFFHILFARTILVVHNDTLYHHMGTEDDYVLV